MTDSSIPSLASLALRYGTIDKPQYQHLTALHELNRKEDKPESFAALLLNQRFATAYQVGLLKLIQEYHIIRKRGEEFGKIAVDMGFATENDVHKALEHQRKEFKRARIKKLIGDILVESGVITEKQKLNILSEQAFLERRASQILEYREDRTNTDSSEISLSDYEKQFLRIKALDVEFAASAVEMGFATDRDIKTAQEIQEQEFEDTYTVKAIGHILVEMKVLTPEQNSLILNQQNRPLALECEQEAKPPIRIEFFQDMMEARAIIASDKVSLEDLKQKMALSQITHGIYPDSVLQCHLEAGDPEFTVAYQDFSENLIKVKKSMFVAKTGLADQQEIQKGQELICEKIKGPVSYDKINVKGEKKKSLNPGRDFTFRSGPGTRTSRDGLKILASKRGTPFVSITRKLYVHPTLHVLEDLDLKYGQPPEPYADMTISGTLTGAFSITAGTIKAVEIRGAKIEAMGDIHVDVGITDSVILVHGNVHARYLHNCRIISFGNIYIQNEIFDSRIFTAGKIDSQKCRVITSQLYAKEGIVLSGTGSKKTEACVLCVGSDHYLLEYKKTIEEKITILESELRDLKTKREEQEVISKKIFQKMVALKMFHDRAKEKKLFLIQEYKTKKENIGDEKQKNILILINKFESRMNQAIGSIKKKNIRKSNHEKKLQKIEAEIAVLKNKTQNKKLSLKQDIYSLYEWSRLNQTIDCKIKIDGTALQGTSLRGVFSKIILKNDAENFSANENFSEDEKQFYIQLTQGETGNPIKNQ